MGRVVPHTGEDRGQGAGNTNAAERQADYRNWLGRSASLPFELAVRSSARGQGLTISGGRETLAL